MTISAAARGNPHAFQDRVWAGGRLSRGDGPLWREGRARPATRAANVPGLQSMLIAVLHALQRGANLAAHPRQKGSLLVHDSAAISPSCAPRAGGSPASSPARTPKRLGAVGRAHAAALGRLFLRFDYPQAGCNPTFAVPFGASVRQATAPGSSADLVLLGCTPRIDHAARTGLRASTTSAAPAIRSRVSVLASVETARRRADNLCSGRAEETVPEADTVE
jgi:hypothetical protein